MLKEKKLLWKVASLISQVNRSYMNRILLFASLLFSSLFIYQFTSVDQNVLDHKTEVKEWQEEMNKSFADSLTSPLTNQDRLQFQGLNFYPINIKYQVTANFERLKNEQEFGMKTTTDRRPTYIRYGIATFKIDNKEFSINIYQNVKFAQMEKYKESLFMLFTDLSSGKQSYAGGRYIDLKIPSEGKLIIDFNKSYNPYCAYNYKYSCPIPPEEDHFDFDILAGCMKSDH